MNKKITGILELDLKYVNSVDLKVIFHFFANLFKIVCSDHKLLV